MDEQEFFQDFQQRISADAAAQLGFTLEAFMSQFANAMEETGDSDGFHFCHLQQRGIRVDGYWLASEDDDPSLGKELNLFLADYASREEMESLTHTDAMISFNRLTNFFSAACGNRLELEETTPEYRLAKAIYDDQADIRTVHCFLCSERQLSQRVKELPRTKISETSVAYHIWDITRLYQQEQAREQIEPIEIDFSQLCAKKLVCIKAYEDETCKSYLASIPGAVLADIYDQYGARLLEQNVRSFLQARGKVNKGIRTTILQEPQMLFAYNNGITATAQEVELKQSNEGLCLGVVKDLQIVNGGQTVASLFHTRRKDKADLSKTAVQMKLSVLKGESEEIEQVIPRISQYANTQNRANAADFFSNHPFHIRMEEISRRLWAPPKGDAQRGTKWFYERARGQYADAQSKMTEAELRSFKRQCPKNQKFTKTDLAKYENVWDASPATVSLGAQKNFARYAERIGTEWKQKEQNFNDAYFRRAAARALCFKSTERLVSAQPWYAGYRANVVAYALALLAEICREHEQSVDFNRIWQAQSVPEAILKTLAITAKAAHDHLINPPVEGQNISEWAKRPRCWAIFQLQAKPMAKRIPTEFWDMLISSEEQQQQEADARKGRKVDDDIDAETKVVQTDPARWATILAAAEPLSLTPKELGILNTALRMHSGGKPPSAKQSAVLLELLTKAYENGI